MVPARLYRPLAARDLFAAWDYQPSETAVRRMVKAARRQAEEGRPGAALKLGHDLWAYAHHATASHEMLNLAYAALGREVLRRQLRRAVACREGSV